MRSRSSSALVVLVIAVTAAAQVSDQKPASVEGIVTNALTGEPILRAHVMCDSYVAGKQFQFGAMTNAEGKFSITGLPAAIYSLTVEKTAFVMPVENGRRSVQASLRSGDAKTDLKLKLMPTGAILGRVVDSDGNPVEGVGVFADSRGPTGIGSRSVMAMTDRNGQFRLGGLTPARYRVVAMPANLPFPPKTRTDGSQEVHNVPTFYPSALDLKDATRPEVRAAADVTGVDIKLQRAFVRVRGIVTGIPAGAPPQSISIETRSPLAGNRDIRGVARDGKFEVWSLDPGKWQVSAVWNSREGSVRSAPVEVEIARQHVDGVELRMVPPFDVSGQATFEDDTARPRPASPSAPQPRMALQEVNRTMAPQPVVLPADGTFRFTNVQPGKYRLITGWRVSIKSMASARSSAKAAWSTSAMGRAARR